MMRALESYLAVRRAAGFDLSNAGYLLASLSALPLGGMRRISGREQQSTGPFRPYPLRNATHG